MKIDCSKVVNFFDEYKRMCADEEGLACSKCPLSYTRNGTDYGCATYIRLYPDKAVEIVQKWSDGHQQKTYKEDFFEKFPNAVREIGHQHLSGSFPNGVVYDLCPDCLKSLENWLKNKAPADVCTTDESKEI